MGTVKFNEQKKLKKLQSKILLETDIELTQQEILELAVLILSENIKLVTDRLSRGSKTYPIKIVDEMLKEYSSNWGDESYDSSATVDEVLYK